MDSVSLSESYDLSAGLSRRARQSNIFKFMEFLETAKYIKCYLARNNCNRISLLIRHNDLMYQAKFELN